MMAGQTGENLAAWTDSPWVVRSAADWVECLVVAWAELTVEERADRKADSKAAWSAY